MSPTKPASAMVIASVAAMLLAAFGAFMLLDVKGARGAASEITRLARAQHEIDRLLAIGLVLLDGKEPPARRGLLLERPTSRLSREDPAQLVDVNLAEPITLARTLTGAGLDAATSATLADRIADWRDEDNLKRPLGAERADYLNGGRPPPANRAFIVETEIAAVLGIDEHLARCLSRHLTTYSSSSVPLAQDRAEQAGGGETANVDAPFGLVMILNAQAQLSEHAMLQRRLWVRMTGDRQRPFMIHRAEEVLTPAAAGSATCVSPSDP